ncbi:MAG: ROK family protein [Selenomonadaceae bacterium]|nr:ROK family protein [Selenomonadaceae bacterium]
MKHYVCMDIGGTFIKHGLADAEGNLLRKGSVATEIREKGVAAFLDSLQGIVEGYRDSFGVAGIAIASPGIVDAEKGEIVFVGNTFPGYTGTKLKEVMERRCGIPCEVENDVNAVGLGECWLGAGRGARSVVCMAVGTNIGGCIVLDGKLLHGAANSAGELGFLDMGDGAKLEETSSTSALVREIAQKRGVAASGLDGERIFADARAGKEDAVRAIDGMVQRIAAALANVCCVLNPQRIVMGGGIMSQEEYLRPRLDAALRERIQILPIRESTELVFAKFRNDAALLGSLCHFLNSRSGGVSRG